MDCTQGIPSICATPFDREPYARLQRNWIQ